MFKFFGLEHRRKQNIFVPRTSSSPLTSKALQNAHNLRYIDDTSSSASDASEILNSASSARSSGQSTPTEIYTNVPVKLSAFEEDLRCLTELRKSLSKPELQDIFYQCQRIFFQKEPKLLKWQSVNQTDRLCKENCTSKQELPQCASRNQLDFFEGDQDAVDAFLKKINDLVDNGDLSLETATYFLHRWSGIKIHVDCLMIVICQMKYSQGCYSDRTQSGLKDLRKIQYMANKCGSDLIERENQKDASQALYQFRYFRPKYFVAILIGHGTQEGLAGTEEHVISSHKDMIHFFAPKKNESIRNYVEEYWAAVPKVFFFQCCNGDKIMTSIPSDRTGYVKVTNGNKGEWPCEIPENTLVVFSTQPEYASSTFPDNGSPFIHSLVNHLVAGSRKGKFLLPVIQEMTEEMTRQKFHVRDGYGNEHPNHKQMPFTLDNLHTDMALKPKKGFKPHMKKKYAAERSSSRCTIS